MTTLRLIKTGQGLQPADPDTEEYLNKLKTGQTLRADFKKERNPQFHRKFFALLNLAYEYWEPGEIDSKYGKPEKDFDRFRHDLLVLAGHYRPVIRIDGSLRVEPESISFGNMNEEKFHKLYYSVLQVIIDRILPNMTGDEVEVLAEQFWTFA